ncbi:MAG: ATP-binding protein [Robiginitomaculum sp.]|nr:ATP-binding protein [Robiginitomaculum sp.]
MRTFMFLLLACVVIIASPFRASADRPVPAAKNGILDLRDWDFSKPHSAIPLKGEWNFTWKHFIHEGAAANENAFSMVNVPHPWRGTNFNGDISDGRGYGTYRLHILLPKNVPHLALKLPGLTYATATVANGELVRMIGKPSSTKAKEKPYYIVDAFALPGAAINQDTLDLDIYISNHFHARGGMTTALILGSAKEIMTGQARYEIFLVALVSGMLALMGYCLVMYFTQRSFRTPLYFALYLLAIATHIGTSKGVFVEAFPFISGQTLLRLEYLSMVVGAYAGFAFIASLYPQFFSKTVHRAILIYNGAAALSLLVLSTYHFSSAVYVYEAGMMLTALAAMIGLWMAARARLNDATFLLVGLGISFIVVSIGIVAHHVSGAPGWLLIYVALITSIIAQATTLGRRINRTVRHTEDLSKQLSQTNEWLEQRVNERTQLLNKALNDAVKANQVKSEFLAAMSHEIRTPMNGVIGMTEAVLGGELSEKQHENVGVIKQSAKALMVILNDILDISKIEAGKMTLESRALCVQDVINRTIALWQQPIQQKGLTLNTVIEGDISDMVLGDETRLGQILSNLLSNACKFTQNGYITLTVKAHDVENVKQLEFRIEDTGPGINRYKVAEIFKPFSQEDQSVSRRHGGTGLGLSISVNLANIMGGTLKYDSAYEQGAAFVFKLALKKTDSAKSIGDKTTPQSAPKPRQLKILVAEDNAINRKVMRAILSKMPYDLSFAEDGAQAYKMADTAYFDVILMDIQMPNIGGIEATRMIQTGTGPNANTPIIAITANAMAGDKEAYLAAGMCGFVSKPINPKDLILEISKATSRSSSLTNVQTKRA